MNENLGCIGAVVVAVGLLQTNLSLVWTGLSFLLGWQAVYRKYPPNGRT